MNKTTLTPEQYKNALEQIKKTCLRNKKMKQETYKAASLGWRQLIIKKK